MRIQLLLFFVLIASPVFCQTWCPPGANWIYEIGGFGRDGRIEYTYTKDTSILGKGCKKITGTFAGTLSNSWPATYTILPNYQLFYSYEENYVIYVYDDGGFDTVVNFDAKVGDKWRAPFNCDYRLALTVTDTGSRIINGVRLRAVSAETKMKFDFNTDTTVFHCVFLEKLFNSDLIFPDLCFNPSVIADYPSRSFICYQDNSFGTYNPGGAPCYKGVGLTEQKVTAYPAGPNPFSDYLEIWGGTGRDIRIFDLDGKVVLHVRTASGGVSRIPTSHLVAGFYILEDGDALNTTNRFKLVKK